MEFLVVRVREVLDPNEWRKNSISGLGEFIGTVSFLWLAYAGQSFAAKPDTSAAGNGNVLNAANVLYVALIYAFSYMINIWIFYPVNGGFFNPAVTFALMIVQAIPFIKGFMLIIYQFIASIVAAYLVLEMFPYPLRASTLLNPDANLAQGVFIEAFLTTLLILTVLVLTVERRQTSFLAPVGIGLALFTAELAGIYYTGASLNPARSLGPAVATEGFGKYHWIYYVGPLIGALLASAVYELFKHLGYSAFVEEQEYGHVRTPAHPIVTEPPKRELKLEARGAAADYV
eukprot:gene6309-6957_t